MASNVHCNGERAVHHWRGLLDRASRDSSASATHRCDGGSRDQHLGGVGARRHTIDGGPHGSVLGTPGGYARPAQHHPRGLRRGRALHVADESVDESLAATHAALSDGILRWTHRRRDGFGAGTKVKSIIERDALCGPSLSNPCGALGDDALAPQNGGDHAETFASPAEYRLQHGININRGVVLRPNARQTRWAQRIGF